MALLSSCRVRLCWCGSICTRAPEYGSPTMIRAFGRAPWTAELLQGFTVAGRNRLACPSLSPLYHLLCSAVARQGSSPAAVPGEHLAVLMAWVFFSFNKVEELGLSIRSGRHLGHEMGWVRRKGTGTCPCNGAEVLNCPSKPPFYHVGLIGLSVSVFFLHRQSAYQNLGRGSLYVLFILL